MANSIQTDALAQLLIEKGIITQDEFFTNLKQVQAEYKSK
jgi:mannitol/fructose-specific phosphotransferase system IIA component (Ntr-type)